MFYHAHDINGKLYYHSHFYWFGELTGNRDTPVKSHSHTDNQLSLIDLFNEITWSSEFSLPEVPSANYLMSELMVQATVHPHLTSHQLNYNLRGPPVI